MDAMQLDTPLRSTDSLVSPGDDNVASTANANEVTETKHNNKNDAAATASAFGAAPVAPAFGSTAAAAAPAFGAAPAAPAAFGGAPPAPGGGGPAFNIGASSTPAGQGRKKLVAKRPWRRK